MHYTWIALELNIFQIFQKFIGNEIIVTNSYTIQAYNSIMWGYFCIGFNDLMLKVKIFYTNLFSPNEYQKNDTIILKYFQ